MKSAGHIDNPALETVARFLESVKEGDSRTFWNTLDKKGQGYFLGLWFYAMESMNVQTIIQLTGDDEFLNGVLEPIIGALRESIAGLLNNPVFGDIIYHTPQCASVNISQGGHEQPDLSEDSIPLVLEISDSESGDANLTCWKIDTLQCFQLNKSMH